MARRYRPAWEAEPQFSGWLTNVEGDALKAFCKLCKCSLQPHKKDLMNHRNCKKHQQALKFSQLSSSTKKLTSFFNADIPTERKIAELKLAAFVAEHCSLMATDHLGELVSNLDKSSELLRDLKIHRTKCSGLIKNVMSLCMLQELIEDIGESHFSAIIDESTAVDTTKAMCIILRYYSKNAGKVVTSFYKLLEVEAGDAETLVNAFKNQLIKDGLDINKLIGIGVDGANVMVGEHNSFSSRLKEVVPELVVVKCVSHSLHLAAENACKILPSHLEFMVRECHNWFSCSSKRQIEYNMLFQTLTGAKPLKIDKLSGTRWLARNEAIIKILEQWYALELHFRLAKEKERCYTASQLHAMLLSKPNKLYFIFLKQTLKAITDVNRMFQSDNVNCLKLFTEITGLLHNYLSILIPPQRLQSVLRHDLANFAFHDSIMSMRCINLGYVFNIEAESKGIPENDLNIIKDRCVQCLIRICEEIQKRIPSNIRILERVSVFCPETATSQVRPDIQEIAVAFKNVVGGVQNLDVTLQEWRTLPLHPWSKTDSTDEFWAEVFSYKNAAGEKAFPHLVKLATSMLSLPFANASVERAFSIMNVIKNKLRNRLLTKTADHIMRVRYGVAARGGCSRFEPTAKMVQMFKSENVYSARDEDVESLNLFDPV